MPFTANQDIIAVAAEHLVVARPAIQNVVARAGPNNVVACARVDGLYAHDPGTFAIGEYAVAIVQEDGVVAVGQAQHVIALAARNKIAAEAAGQIVAAAFAKDSIIAGRPVNRVCPSRAVYDVGTFGGLIDDASDGDIEAGDRGSASAIGLGGSGGHRQGEVGIRIRCWRDSQASQIGRG